MDRFHGNLPRSAFCTACTWGAMRLVALTACWLEAAHRVGTWGAASLGSTIAVVDHITGGIELGGNMTIRRNNMVRSVAVATAGVVHLQLERDGALVLTALNL